MVKNLFSLLNKGTFFTIISLSFLILYVISLFLNLEVAPFYNEEPRRSIIAMEMLFNKNFVVTTLFNDVFYDHPPLWNIILAGSSWLFGTDTEFAFRFPSALSLLLTGILIYFMGKKHVGHVFGIVSSFLYMVSVDLYFFFSNTAEIDIFFSLLILASIIGIYHFYEQKKFTSLFLYAYFFCFLGFLTKGVVSLVFWVYLCWCSLFIRKIIKNCFSLYILFPHFFVWEALQYSSMFMGSMMMSTHT